MQWPLSRVIVLGLATGIAFGLGVTGFESGYFHGWRGYDLDVFGTTFPGAVGDVIYSVGANAPFNFGLGCLFGWLAWGAAAAQSGNAAARVPTPGKPGGHVLALAGAVLCGLLFAVTWAAVNPTSLNPPLPVSRLFRTIGVIGVAAIGVELCRFVWRRRSAAEAIASEQGAPADGSRD